MGLFSPRRTREPAAAGSPPMGSGRKLRTALSLPDALGNLEALLGTYRTPKYRAMPAFHRAGYRWLASDVTEPDAVVSFSDNRDEFMLATFWAGDGATEWGLFPLGGGDDRLVELPLIGNWKMRDRTLSSAGTLPAGMIVLAPPVITEGYLDELLHAGGAAATPRNRAELGLQLAQMLLIKAQEFISSKDPAAASRFVDRHRLAGQSPERLMQGILDDLAAAYFGTLPYIQDLPDRFAALLLEPGPDGDPAPIWSRLER